LFKTKIIKNMNFSHNPRHLYNLTEPSQSENSLEILHVFIIKTNFEQVICNVHLKTTIPAYKFICETSANAAKLKKSEKSKVNMLVPFFGGTRRKTRNVTNIKSYRNGAIYNPNIARLRSQRCDIRELQNECTIEEIVRDRSLKVFDERCKVFYKPPKSDIW
ncbi:unnamed protein product, partial [Meganyctiphanes norvegica]